jgi:D-arabinose 1-dehydrogenase-like Zn-dependent alcohol dehydrogenase
VDSDRSVRKAMTQAMLASIVAESTSEQPSEDALRVFHEKNASLFGSATFAEIREQVEAVYRQHTRDDALRKYLEWLRSEAKIVLVPGAIQ